jgi:hypothetical protein
MNRESEMDATLVRFASRLEELGISATFSTVPAPSSRQGTVSLARRGSSQDYALLYGAEVTFAELAHATGEELPALMLTTYASPKTANAYRRYGVQYLDAAGNAWIQFGDVLVDVRGRPRPPQEKAPKRIAGNLFSAGRAQVVCALLAWPRLWHAGRRDLADAAGVSLGHASTALGLLAEAGYTGEETRPTQTPLLDLWAAAFPTGLAANLTLGTFLGNIDEIKLPKEGDVAFVSGERAATDLLRPATLTLYVEQLDPRLAIVNRWRTDGRPNITVRRAFWQNLEEDVPSTGLATAPWPLVYADLLASDDPRVRSAAQAWRDRNARSDQHAA